MRRALIFILLAGVVAGAWWQFAPRAVDTAKKPATPPPVPVVLAKAESRDMPVRLEVTGRTEAYESVTLKSRVEGMVQAVTFTEGQAVRQGEILLRLDPADFQARLAQAEANAARSQAQLAKARADLERYLALKAKGFVSDEKVGDIRTALAATENSAKADAAAADLVRLQLGYTTVKAPFAGIVGAKLVFPGTAVKPNETALAVVNRIRPLYVNFAVPEKYLPQIRAGLAANKSLAAAVSLPGSGVPPFDGQVRFVDNAVDSSTGTILLKAVLPNAEDKLTAGQLVSVSLGLSLLKDAVVIPAEAVQQGPEGSFVYVIKDEVAELRKVRVGFTQNKLAVIAEGLAAGDSVVTEGQLRLTPGAKIKPAGAGKPAGEKRPGA